MFRRTLIRQLCVLGLGVYAVPAQALKIRSALLPYMPDEAERHARTWMAFAANPAIWPPIQVSSVFRDLALIATTIAQYEPVSVLVSASDMTLARRLLRPDQHPFVIDLVECEVDDLWLRDTGPVFVRQSRNQGLAAVDFNFNGWGGKQVHQRDALVAAFIAQQTNTPLLSTELVLEGGCFEVDGAGTAIVTESCVLNENRNPGWAAADVEAELKRLLGVVKVIWLKGIAGRDITDGHTDFYARFVRPGEVIVSRDNYRASYDYDVTRQNIAILSKARDATGRMLKVTIVDTPDDISSAYDTDDYAAGYVGYYVCNNALIMQKFGDTKADAAAKAALQKAYPDRIIEQISIDAIASGGGSVHCATQQQIAITN